MAVGLFLLISAIALLWSGLKNKDLREAIPLILQNKDPDSASPISKELPPIGAASTGSSGDFDTADTVLGERVQWGKARVFVYGLMLNKAFNTRVISHCRTNSITKSGNISLHDVRNNCRALDLVGSKNNMRKLARWANRMKNQGHFQEAIYTHETTPGISDEVIADHDGRNGTEHVHIGFPVSGKVPHPPSYRKGATGKTLERKLR